MQNNFVSPHALAKISGWPTSRIKKLVAEKRIKFIKVGGKTLIPSNALDEFLEANLNLPDRQVSNHRQN
jgi:excisionase family DNA binding protein